MIHDKIEETVFCLEIAVTWGTGTGKIQKGDDISTLF